MVDIDRIIVPVGRRTAGDDPIFAASIEKVGIIEPIILAPDLTLICGARRLDQCGKLGWKTIPVHIRSYDEIDRELVELEGNLTHAAHSYLERIKQLKRHKELYEAKYPEARHGNTRERAAMKRQGGDLPNPYTEIAGKTLSVSQRKIQRDIKLAGELSDEVTKLIWNKKVANKPKELARLAKHDSETQLKLGEEIRQNRANDVRRAELNLKINLCAVTPSDFHSEVKSIWFILDKANRDNAFQNASDQSYAHLDDLVSRIEWINSLTTNWLEYDERKKPRLVDAA